MNAVPTLPIKPEIPVNGPPAAVHREDGARSDATQAAPSFMAALHKVKAEKPLDQTSEDPADAAMKLPAEEQPAPFMIGDVLLETDPVEPQAMALIERTATIFPGDGEADATGQATNGETPSEAEKGSASMATAKLEADQVSTRPSVHNTPAAQNANQDPGMPAAKPQSDGVATRPVIFKAPESGNVPREPGRAATDPQSDGVATRPVIFKAPESGNVPREPRMPSTDPQSEGESAKTLTEGESAKSSDMKSPEAAKTNLEPGTMGPKPVEGRIPQTTARMITTDNRGRTQGEPKAPAALPEGVEDLQRTPVAVSKTTVVPITRSSDGLGRQENVTTPSGAPNLAAILGRGPGNTATETPDAAPTVRLTMENESTSDGRAFAGDADTTEDNPRRWLPVDQALEANRGGRSARFEVDSRPEWITAVDRNGPTPVSKASQALFVEKAPAPTAESFRAHNVSQIVERIAVSVRGNQSEARIALKPDHLGSIRLLIATDNNTVSIKIMTEFPMARDLLESHLPQLKTDLQQQGLELDKFDVTLNEEEHSFRREDRRQQGAFHQRFGSGPRDETSDPPGDEIPENRKTDQGPPTTGVDFFA